MKKLFLIVCMMLTLLPAAAETGRLEDIELGYDEHDNMVGVYVWAAPITGGTLIAAAYDYDENLIDAAIFNVDFTTEKIHEYPVSDKFTRFDVATVKVMLWSDIESTIAPFIKNADFTVNGSNSFAVVRTSQSVMNNDYEEVSRIFAYRGFYTEEYETIKNVEAPGTGSVFLPLLNASNKVEAVRLLATVKDGKVNVEAAAKAANSQRASGKSRYYYGEVAGVKRPQITLKEAVMIDDALQDTFVVRSMANVYMYDERIQIMRNRVSDADISSVYVKTDPVTGEITYDDGCGEIGSYYIFACEYEGMITDVMLYVFKK